VGTYLHTEFAFSARANEKSDVYSYGVVLLELATGRTAVEGDELGDLVSWTQWRIRQKHGLKNSLDKRLGYIPEDTQEEMMMVLRIGLFCTNASPAHRPCMRDVLRMLVDVKISSIPMASEGKTRAAKSQLLPTLSVAAPVRNFSSTPDLIIISP
jgi:serine/threonine protein kinase